MKPIKWVITSFKRWRRCVRNTEYRKGVSWAYTAYHMGDFTAEEIEMLSKPSGNYERSPFEQGLVDAAIELTRVDNESVSRNDNGDPVGVPYFIGQTRPD